MKTQGESKLELEKEKTKDTIESRKKLKPIIENMKNMIINEGNITRLNKFYNLYDNF